MDLSIIIPSFNHSNFLPKCLDSIIFQTEKSLKYEVILIDDASSDNSLEVAKGYKDKLPINILSHTVCGNQGAVATINEGIRLASGKYLAILNSDDEYLSNHFSVIKSMIATEPDVILAKPRVETMLGAPGVADGYLQEGLQALGEFGPEEGLFLRNYFMTTSAIITKTKVAKAIGGFDDLKFTYDWDFALRCMDSGSVAVSSQESMIWREHAANTISTGTIHEHHFENATLRVKLLFAKSSKERRIKTIGDWMKLEDSSNIIASTWVISAILRDSKVLKKAIAGKPLGAVFYKTAKENYYNFLNATQSAKTLELTWLQQESAEVPGGRILVRQLLSILKQIAVRIIKVISR